MLKKIYSIAPAFRAEKPKTKRHLSEYWRLEAAVSNCDLQGIIQFQEQVLQSVCKNLSEEACEEFGLLNRSVRSLGNISVPFQRLTYEKALELLKRGGINVTWGEELNFELEKVISLRFSEPFFITEFPITGESFFYKSQSEDLGVSLSADLLAPEGYGEITGGGQRIHIMEQLLARIKEERLNPDDYKWYTELRRFGTVPHSGFGMGVERVVAWVCGLEHIRDAISFPRLLNRIYP